MRTIQRRLTAYRDELKGIAILLVVFFHAGNLRLPVWLSEGVQSFGYGGVDIFFFLSGYGLYHSLAHDNNLKRYILRRAKRILPAYLPVCVAWLIIMIPILGFQLMDNITIVAGNLFMMGFFGSTPRMISWYISGLVLSLLLAPFIFEYLRRGERPEKRVLILMVIAVGIGLSFSGTRQYTAIARLPIFVLGMGFAIPENKQSRAPTALLCWLSFIIGYIMLRICKIYLRPTLRGLGMHWYPFILVVPPMCIGLGWFFEKTSVARAVFAPLRYFGKASFEIFLFNVWVELLVSQKVPCFSGAEACALWSLGSIAMGCLYHLVILTISKRRKAPQRVPEAYQ